MPFIETRREDICALKGVHLFHFATSNCSQRVRFVLEEKGVSWVSHHVNLIKCENATPEFLALNPKGLVPVLIHDGRTMIESNDIIQYVDEHFEGPALIPERQSDRDYLADSLKRSSNFQASLKLLTHVFLFKPFRRMNERQLKEYSEGVKNSDLVDFMRVFSSKDGFSRERIIADINETENNLENLESRLENRRWLTADEFGLADISWIVNIHRLSQFNYPLASYPLLMNWLSRVRARRAFSRAISRFQPKKQTLIFNIYTMIRRLQGSSVQDYVAAR